jgi:hypothetical protein
LQAQILFQQNLNHFWEASPGKLDVAISYDLSPSDSSASWSTLITLDDFAANDMCVEILFCVCSGVGVIVSMGVDVSVRVGQASCVCTAASAGVSLCISVAVARVAELRTK